MFEQLKDDSSSLIVLYDSASFVTERSLTTTATSGFSLNFAFDSELLQHRAYKGVLRALMRMSTRRSNSSRKQAEEPKLGTLPEVLKEVHVWTFGFPDTAWKDIAPVLIPNLPRNKHEPQDYCSAIQTLVLSEISSAFVRRSEVLQREGAPHVDLDSGCAVVEAARDGPHLRIAREVVHAIGSLSQNDIMDGINTDSNVASLVEQ